MNSRCPKHERVKRPDFCDICLQAENEHLSNTVESTRQDYADLLDGTMEAKLQAENERLRELLNIAKGFFEPDCEFCKDIDQALSEDKDDG